jgi:hypothetical protein
MTWKVTEFDLNTLWGLVTSDTGASFIFHSTSFQAANSVRWPRLGESVDVVTTNAGALLAVHSIG